MIPQPELLIENTHLVNVYTGEILLADIAIAQGRVLHTGKWNANLPEPAQRYDAKGKFAAPGLIDSHIHIESSMMSPAGFAAAVLPRGTTTVVVDPHEIANVLGLRGVRYMLEVTADLPLRVLVQAPSCVPAVPTLETAGADFGAAEVGTMLGWERVIGLAEVMDYVGVIEGAPRMREILATARAHGTVISGHCPGLQGTALSAYIFAGPLSDHEGGDPDELLEKLRVGMVVEARVSSFSESMTVLGAIVRELGHVPPNLGVCTDDTFPEDLAHRGHMDRVVREAIAAGFPPVQAFRAATLHGAQRHRLHDLGAIAPGKRADLLLLTDLEYVIVDEVFCSGQLIAREGKLLKSITAAHPDLERENTIHLNAPLRNEDFRLRALPGESSACLHVLDLHNRHNRQLTQRCFRAQREWLELPEGVCLAAVIERHGRNGHRSLTPIEGLGLQRGAIASTVAHDSHNLLVVGCNPADMTLAAQTLARSGGGICCAVNSEVLAFMPLPIAGLMSPEPLETLTDQMVRLNAALNSLGLEGAQPISSIIGLALPVIPHYGLTDLGLVDVDRQVVMPLRVEEKTMDGQR
ncbi:MAG: adenine deaminase [Anaerolineae bacterium]|nr:adenine deaminase [Anaerolineae bacterium]